MCPFAPNAASTNAIGERGPCVSNAGRQRQQSRGFVVAGADGGQHFAASHRSCRSIVRRFYQRQSFAEIGAAAGVTAEAARKRVSRSLVEVKQLMLRNGEDAIPNALLASFSSSAKSNRRSGAQSAENRRIKSILKETSVMTAQQAPAEGGHQMISAEFLVKDVEANLAFFEKLGFPRRFIDKPDATGRIPRASLTAGHMGKIWIRRAGESRRHPSLHQCILLD